MTDVFKLISILKGVKIIVDSFFIKLIDQQNLFNIK